MKYKFRVGQRVRMTKTINRPRPYEGTVNGISLATNTIFRPDATTTRTVDVRVDGASSVTRWPLNTWRVIL